MQGSPFRYLKQEVATFWIGWDEKAFNISGVIMGTVEWKREIVPQPRAKLSWYPWAKSRTTLVMEYQLVDVFGQRWLGKGSRGHIGTFTRLKEI